MARAFDISGLTFQQLYWDYVVLGGGLDPWELEAILFSDLEAEPRAYNVLAQALNEALMDDGRAERVASVAWPAGHTTD